MEPNHFRFLLTAALLFSTVAGCAGTPEVAQQSLVGEVVTDDGVRLHFEVKGSGQDTLIVLHGGPGLSSAYFGTDLDFLARNHTLVFYDQRGAGRSTIVADSARLRLADHIRDLEAVRRHFRIERVTLLGHSWGAALAAHYARTHQDRTARVILVDAMPPRRTPWIEQFGRTLMAWMDSATSARFAALAAAQRNAKDPVTACRAFWTLFIRGYFADPHDSSLPARMHGDVCDAPPEALNNGDVVNASALGPLGDWDWRQDFRGVTVPVLIIHGAKDPIPAASASEWQAAFPRATLVLLERAGHFAYVDKTEEFLRAVEAFLR